MCEQGTSFVSVNEAAVLLETTEMRILMMLRANELVGRMEDELWVVDRSSLSRCRKPQAAEIVRPAGCGGSCGSGCGGH